jgi:hypothetical protein
MKITQKRRQGSNTNNIMLIIHYLVPNLFLDSHMCYVMWGGILVCEKKKHLQENKSKHEKYSLNPDHILTQQNNSGINISKLTRWPIGNNIISSVDILTSLKTT